MDNEDTTKSSSFDDREDVRSFIELLMSGDGMNNKLLKKETELAELKQIIEELQMEVFKRCNNLSFSAVEMLRPFINAYIELGFPDENPLWSIVIPRFVKND